MTNEELVRAYQDGDKEAMNEIVEKNTGLVFLIVNRYLNSLESSYLDRDDLEQLGYMGLMEAVKHFDTTMGFKFSTYASKAIMGYIARGLRYSTPWEKRSDTSGAMAQVISADSFLPGSESMTYMETIEDPDAQNDFHNMICAIDDEILHRDLFDVLNRVFNLDDKPRNAIILKYGLTGRPHTFKEIGDAYGAPLNTAAMWVKTGIRRIRSSRAGHALKRKYQVEYSLSTGRERLSRLEYKDPSRYTQEKEWFRDMQRIFNA
ncbi:sigma-70 family RNA polymerase sigma factor [Acetobacterium wieringae]|uniref:Sigma-70 family RNA polymerase sigma factor n=1 Tax=Acetobacterium wieringae TaxID=52694 RepID=A0ABY6HFW9_9FIRM|nr:sigma-70 family RNA polymerase sigma factor [Acetobacterium wieringae]UYO63441.1 sigma-70 family RNA polymerase sigma factor [Acetobacterium wieringae]VUZ27150.1 RNA polymerase sigma factor RpoS [Acetobacterium wieringae]